MYGAPCKARNFNVVYKYGPTFGNAKSSLFLIAAQCFKIESMQKVVCKHSASYQDYPNYKWDLIR
jgi:hypothetical protein